jgi:8-oxo-dGTP pyrophosphatase MutT (NUDIX family)
MKDFLLEEYRSLTQSMQVNEEIGEKRLTFYITLITSVLGGIVALLTSFDSIPAQFLPLVKVLVIALLTAIFLIGHVIYKRMQKRNQTTDGFKKDLRRIRNMMKLKYAESSDTFSQYYYSFGVKNEKRKDTSLVNIVGILNAFVAGITVFLLMSFLLEPTPHLVALSVILGIAGTLPVIFWLNRKDSLKATHAGGVVVKKELGQTQVLLVTSSKTGEWVLPKGHIEKEQRESANETAVREVREESGYEAEVIAFLNETEPYIVREKRIMVAYFLMFPLGEQGATSEGRKIQWFPISEAIRLVQHEENRKVLREAALIY